MGEISRSRIATSRFGHDVNVIEYNKAGADTQQFMLYEMCDVSNTDCDSN